jgi:hypothetical protein
MQKQVQTPAIAHRWLFFIASIHYQGMPIPTLQKPPQPTYPFGS